jgi:glycosyltransferase involved in cell wall biosynthesis
MLVPDRLRHQRRWTVEQPGAWSACGTEGSDVNRTVWTWLADLAVAGFIAAAVAWVIGHLIARIARRADLPALLALDRSIRRAWVVAVASISVLVTTHGLGLSATWRRVAVIVVIGTTCWLLLRLLVVGEGSLAAALHDQAEAAGLLGEPCTGDACVGTRQARPGAAVVFTGRREDVPAVTAALDVAVLPSYREAQGLSILEAMAMELPIVVFPEQCGCAELIAHGENGFLVSSEAEACDVIERLRAEPDLRRRVGRAARQTLIDLQHRQEPELLARYRSEPLR